MQRGILQLIFFSQIFAHSVTAQSDVVKENSPELDTESTKSDNVETKADIIEPALLNTDNIVAGEIDLYFFH